MTPENVNVLHLVLASTALVSLLHVCRRGAECARTQRGRDLWSWASIASIVIVAGLLLRLLVREPQP